jgi:hypothetical protein
MQGLAQGAGAGGRGTQVTQGVMGPGIVRRGATEISMMSVGQPMVPRRLLAAAVRFPGFPAGQLCAALATQGEEGAS